MSFYQFAYLSLGLTELLGKIAYLIVLPAGNFTAVGFTTLSFVVCHDYLLMLSLNK
jgi:hypothetical protein